ncbi:MAG: glutamyl-tRNA reductase [bacterium]|nr:glutamyl-tRNA reductase [bacterium]
MIKLISKDTKSDLVERERYLTGLKDTLPDKHVLLQTCNRVEVYSGEKDIPVKIARHLFRVVSGLESTFTGETAIQAQVKNAYLASIKKGTVSSGLHKLFQSALRVGKRVRTETDISRGALSYSQAVVDMIKKNDVIISDSNILILGVSNINLSVIKFLVSRSRGTIFIANRTYEKALSLSQKLGCKAFRFDQLDNLIKNCDILISATSAPHYIVKYENYINNRKIHIFDLAVPRDIDPRIGQYPEVSLYNIEVIEQSIQMNLNERRQKVKSAENIIEEELAQFYE